MCSIDLHRGQQQIGATCSIACSMVRHSAKASVGYGACGKCNARRSRPRNAHARIGLAFRAESCPVLRYTMRLCRLGEDRPDDFQFFVDGKAAGRCYLMKAAGNRVVWRWTVYGISGGGIEDTLAQAQRRFKETYEAGN